MKNNIGEKIFGLLCFLFAVVFLIGAIINGDEKAIVFSILLFCIIVIPIIIIVIVSLVCDYKDNIKVKQYRKIKNKEHKSIFEKIYIKAFQNKFDDELKEIIRNFDIKDLKDFDVKICNKDLVQIYYRYNKFQVFTFIDDNKIMYYIDTPQRYDGSKENKLFESKKYFCKKTNEYNSLDELYNEFIFKTKSIQNDVNEFIDKTYVDDVFNGRLFNKLKNLKNYMKTEGVLALIFGTFITSALVAMLIYVFNTWDMFDSAFSFVCFIVVYSFLVLFFLFFMICGAYYVITLIRMKKDINKKEILTVSGKPKKVRICNDQYSRYSKTRYIRYLKVWFDNVVVIIPFSNREILMNPENKKICYQECLKVNKELTYLKRSKIVIKGDNSYLECVKKYLL